MNNKCLNYAVCHNQAAKGSDLCEDCRRAVIHLVEQDDPQQTLRKLEQKPRTWRDAFGVRKAGQ